MGFRAFLPKTRLATASGTAFIGIDALPGIEVSVLIVGGEGTVESDVVPNHLQPVDLAFGEAGR